MFESDLTSAMGSWTSDVTSLWLGLFVCKMGDSNISLTGLLELNGLVSVKYLEPCLGESKQGLQSLPSSLFCFSSHFSPLPPPPLDQPAGST